MSSHLSGHAPNCSCRQCYHWRRSGSTRPPRRFRFRRSRRSHRNRRRATIWQVLAIVAFIVLLAVVVTQTDWLSRVTPAITSVSANVGSFFPDEAEIAARRAERDAEREARLAEWTAEREAQAKERAAEEERDLQLQERTVGTLTNLERERYGLEPLQWDKELQAIARAHSRDMAENNYFSHDNQEGQGPTARGEEAGYLCQRPTSPFSYTYGLGENIYHGGGPDEAVESWMDSPGHKANILDSTYEAVGVGIHGGYTTQVFC